MRWELIDRFDVLLKGNRALAWKAYTGQEDFFTEHEPGHPVVPETLLIEMIAQAGGVLFGLGLDFKKEVILAKIENARFIRETAPPCRFRVEAKIEESREEGAWISGEVSSQDGLCASAKIMLVTIDKLVEEPGRKIVFNDRFLSHYDIWNVAQQSEKVRA